MKKRFDLFTVLALMLLTASVTYVAVSSFTGIDSDLTDDVKKYAEIRQLVDDVYIGEYDSDAMSDAVMTAVVESLEDNWSYYMSADEYQEYLLSQQNQYSGIGVTVSKDEDTGGLSIVSVQDDTPAADAGLEAGEIIIAVGGTDITDMTVSEAKEIITSHADESFDITVLDSSGDQRIVTLNCEVIYTSPVSYEMLDGNVGLVVIENFDSGACDEFIAAVDDLIAQGAEALIFDVRNNPGGLVSELTAMLDYLLPEGDVFISVDKDGNETIETSDESCVELPMAVIVNRYSYSAAEFFAAALSEYDWATIVGEQTTGKGRSQVTKVLSDGSAVHISTRVYMTPNRVDLSEAGGITPDIEVEVSDEEFVLIYYGQIEYDNDPQLQAAVKVVLKE